MILSYAGLLGEKKASHMDGTVYVNFDAVVCDDVAV